GETTPGMQGLLLRLLETGAIQRVGSERAQTRVEVRVVAATNRALVDAVALKLFREDLYYRLDAVHLSVPRLREPLDDIPLLLQAFLQLFARQYQTRVPPLSEDALALLLAHAWPGSVRELKNVAERLTIRAAGRKILSPDLPPDVLRSVSAAS